MSFRLVGVELLTRSYQAEPDGEGQARMDDRLADLLDDPWSRSHEAVEFLISDGDHQVELKGFLSL